MNKKLKYLLGAFGIAFVAVSLTACNSFCSDEDVSHFMYAYDPLNIRIFDNQADAEDYIGRTFEKLDTYKEGTSFNVSDLYIEEGTALTASDYIGSIAGSSLVYVKGNVLNLPASYSNLETPASMSYEFGLSDFTKTIVSSAKTSGINIPSYEFYEAYDATILTTNILPKNSALSLSTLNFEGIYGYTYAEYTAYLDDTNEETKKEKLADLVEKRDEKSLLANYGNAKFIDGYRNPDDTIDYLNNVKSINNSLEGSVPAIIGSTTPLTSSMVMSQNYLNLYKTNLDQKTANVKTCISIEDGFYGHTSDDPLNDTVLIGGQNSNFIYGWGPAFSHGFLEGLLVYPIGYLTDYLSHAFGMNGFGQIWAVVLVTIIVRLFFMAITLPSTISQQKQTNLQPEIAKLQQKYPNSNTNDYEKQRLAQAQMALYKKHKVHPFLSMLTLVIQFPLFIAVWNGMQGTAALSRDAVLGLRLSDTVWQTLTNFSTLPGNGGGWWTALILILLMSVGQVLSMLIPQILQKRRTKNVAKTGVNPAQNSQAKTMKIVQWGMIIMTIVLGFTLPSAMGVYWLAGSIFNICQSLIMHLIFSRKKKERV